MAKYITPAITPFTGEGDIDEHGLEALYEHLIAGGVDGILTLGSIGEFFSIPLEKKKRLITLAVRQAAGRVPVIAGTSDMLFDNVVSLSEYALAEGADAVIVVSPYYFRLEPEQTEAYYDALAQRIAGRIYLYNFPDRTGYSIPADVVRRLAEKHPNIVGCKDTIAGLDHTRELIKAVKPLRPDFEIYSGFDDNFAHNVLCGGDGCIAGLSNVAPALCHRWAQAVNAGDWAASARLQQTIDRLMDIYAVGAPFIPFIKRATALRGVPVNSAVSFPFPAVTEEQDEALRRILAREDLL
ncbi:MAG: dihydrodipicolinate synthase family protein [Clostridia bacterium]|nr:dihydrodipicolinate synthase family protein [Clostridia bacterium]